MPVVLAIRNKLAVVANGHGYFGAALQTMATRLGIFTLNIGTSVITARTMGAEGRGLLAALLTWPQFIAFLTTFGLTSSLLYNVKSSPCDSGRLLGAAIILVLLAGSVASLGGVVMMPWMIPGYGINEVFLARLLMMTAPIILLTLLIQTAAEAIRDFPGANALRGISVIGTFVAVALLTKDGALSPINAALAYLLPQAPVGCWLFWRLRPRYKPTLQAFRRSASVLISYGRRCYPVEIVNTAVVYAGQALVIAMVSPVEVGYFVVSVGVSRLLEVIYTTVVTILLPTTTGRHPSEITMQTLRAARITFILMMSAVVPLSIALPVIMPIVYGASFANAKVIAQILLVEGTLSGTVWVMMQAFFALGRPEPPMILQVTTLVLLVPAMLFVIPIYGAAGAAAVLLAMAIIKVLIASTLYRVVLQASPSEILPRLGDLFYLYSLSQR